MRGIGLMKLSAHTRKMGLLTKKLTPLGYEVDQILSIVIDGHAHIRSAMLKITNSSIFSGLSVIELNRQTNLSS